MDDYLYEAFITYKHDKVDTRVAKDVQNYLEHYRIPPDLQKLSGIKKFKKVFRDTTELSGTNDLTKEIEDALIHSRFLIVICSDKTKESVWVPREIEIFLKHHDEEHILTVLAGGDPPGVIPDILLKRTVQDSTEKKKVTEEVEPLSCDFRKKSWRARREEIPRIAARFLNCSYDDLIKRESRYRRKKSILVLTLVGCAAIGFICYLLWSNNQIKNNYRESVRQKMRYAATGVKEELEKGRRIKALTTAVSAAEGLSDDELLMAPELLNLIEEGSGIYDTGYHGLFGDIINTQEICLEDTLMNWAADNKGRYVCAVDENGTIYIWSCIQGKLVYKDKIDGYSSEIAVTEDEIAVVSFNDQVRCIDCNSGEVLWNHSYGDYIQSFYEMSSDMLRVLTSEFLYSVDIRSGTILDDTEYGDIMPEIIQADKNYKSYSLRIQSRSDNRRWVVAEIQAEEDAYAGEYLFPALIDMDSLKVSPIDVTAFDLSEDRYLRYWIADDGVIVVVDSEANEKCNRICRVDPADGLIWEFKVDSIVTYDLRVMRGGIELDPHSAKVYFQYDRDEVLKSGNIRVLVGTSIITLDAKTGETLSRITSSSETKALSENDNDFFAFMPGKIGYQNSGGGFTAVTFPMKEYEDVIDIGPSKSWNNERIFIFANKDLITVYTKVHKVNDIAEYDPIPDCKYAYASFCMNDGIVLMTKDDSFENDTLTKYQSESKQQKWRVQLDSFADFLGIDYVNNFIYFYDRVAFGDDNCVIKAVNTLDGNLVSLDIIDSIVGCTVTYQSSVELIGVAGGSIVYTIPAYANSEGICLVGLYDPKQDKTITYTSSFDIDAASVVSDHEIVCYSDKKEAFILDLTDGDYVQTDKRYAESEAFPKISGKRLNDSMFAIWAKNPMSYKELRVYSNDGRNLFNIDEKSQVITLEAIDDSIFVLFENGFINRYSLTGSLLNSINLNTYISVFDTDDIFIRKNTEGNIVISGFFGVYIIDPNYNAIRSNIPYAVGYDYGHDALYMETEGSDHYAKSFGYIRRKTPSELIEIARSISG